MLQSPQAQAAPMTFDENTEGDGDPKTGNTCNALSGNIQQNSIPTCLWTVQFPPCVSRKHSLSLPFSACLLLPQVPSRVCPTSLVSGGRVGGVVSTSRFPAAAWPPRRPSTRRCTAWAGSNATSWTRAWTCCRNSSTGITGWKSGSVCSGSCVGLAAAALLCFVLDRTAVERKKASAKMLHSSDALSHQTVWDLIHLPGCHWRKPLLSTAVKRREIFRPCSL